MINPQVWAETIVNCLEQRGIVGVLLPDDGSGGNDRFVPRRVFITYKWSGKTSAETKINFKIKTPEDQSFINFDNGNYQIVSCLSANWGNEWEDVEISIPSTISFRVEIKEVNRFSLGITIVDEKQNDNTYIRKITIENLRQRNGTIHGLRVFQNNLPELLPIRNSTIDEDRYYRASGLIGFFNDGQTQLEFKSYAVLPERARRPVQGPSIEEAVNKGILSKQTATLFDAKGYSNLFEFQADSISKIGNWLENGSQGAAILLNVGTAAGKTEAFLMPLLDRLREDKQYFGVQGLFVYPMKALQSDQARRFFEYLAKFNDGRQNPLSIGIINGDTQRNIESVSQLEKRGEFRSPFASCPMHDCNGYLRFSVDENKKDFYSSPLCSKCRTEFPWIRFHQEQIKEFPPSILLITPDSLHRQISNNMAWQSQTLFGRPVHICADCGRYTASSTKSLRGDKLCSCDSTLPEPVSTCPSLIVFDEAHLLKGILGSNVALLISRVKNIARQYGHRPVLIGSSATIASPQEFGLQLFGGKTEVVKGREEQDETAPTRYHLFFMPVKVTVLNAVGHTLTGSFIADSNHNETNRILIFSDAKRTVYQLQASLPEFYATEEGNFVDGLFSTTRSHTGDLSFEERQKVELAFDRGEIRVLLATQTLEVGVDFENLQLEIQTGATYSYNDYIQRVGRAGRKGVPALVTCILRPQVPLDYYYYEHCRELVQFSEDNLDEVPIRSDNPFLIEQQVPASIQDYLISNQEGAKLMWFIRDAVNVLTNNTVELEQYLTEVFNPPHALEPDLINEAIRRSINKVIQLLRGNVNSGNNPSDLLKQIIKLSIRSTDVEINVNSDDFDEHRGISLAGELADENFDDDPEFDEEIIEE